MKKYFVVTDVHSYFTLMKDALEQAGYDKANPNHIFVSCGDLLDRGDESAAILTFVNSIPKSRKILIKGNHEDLLERCLDEESFHSNDLHNGTLKTIYNLAGKTEFEYFVNSDTKNVFSTVKAYKPLYKYLNSLQDYAEVGNYMFVHGWFPSGSDWSAEAWEEARWMNGMEAWKKGEVLKGKTIVCGHWHCSWGWSHLDQLRPEFPPKNRKNWEKSFEPYIKEGIIALDACTAYSKKVNVVVLEI